MKIEIIRRLDELGRIVLPREMRNALDWNEDSKISITRQGNRLILQIFQDGCIVCGNEENIVPIHGKLICQMCIDEITETK